MIERVARAIALELGDNLDHAFDSKSEWNAARGEKGGRFRDINEPFRSDYIDAARIAIEAMLEPARAPLTELRHHLKDKPGTLWDDHLQHWLRELDAALSPSTETP